MSLRGKLNNCRNWGGGGHLMIGKLQMVSYAWEGNWNPWGGGGGICPPAPPWSKLWLGTNGPV